MYQSFKIIDVFIVYDAFYDYASVSMIIMNLYRCLYNIGIAFLEEAGVIEKIIGSKKSQTVKPPKNSSRLLNIKLSIIFA